MLNTKHFVVLAGNPEKWDNEIRNTVPMIGDCFESSALCAVQSRQHSRGRLSAVLSSSIYGWSVRSGCGLSGFTILAGARRRDIDGSKEAAIAWGIAWANADPVNREFYASKSDMLK